MEEIIGKLQHVIFSNETTGYAVISFKCENVREKRVIATGMLANLNKDYRYKLEGEYVEHPRYGMQFACHMYEQVLPEQKDGIIKYLSSPQFVGIGKKIASDIYDVLGDNALNLIRENFDVLDQVPSISDVKKEAIINGFNNIDDTIEKTLQFFLSYGISTRNIMRLNLVYGKDAISKVSENPYRVIYDCDGFGFKTADKLALHLGFAKDNINRLEALLVSLCMEVCLKLGDTFVDRDVLETYYIQNTNLDNYDLVLSIACKNRHLVSEEMRIYHYSQYTSEYNIAYYLNTFPFEELDNYDQKTFDECLALLQQEIVYNDKQIEAIKNFFNNPFSIITGGPGTGKTTVVKALTNIFKKLYPSNQIVCIAPTGRASKRIAQLCDVRASTIHSLLQWNLETNTFGKNKEEPLNIDVLIIDEFSMVDNYLFANLCDAGAYIKKICIIGDENQLPSVSPGCLLHDLIASNQFPLVRLDHIYRQVNGSDISNLAHDIVMNQVNFQNYNNDLKFYECDKYNTKDMIVKMVDIALSKGYDINDIQVLAPMYKGLAGIDRLNKSLQERFNPKESYKKEIVVGYQTFREQDKILQLKNQPDDDVYNGDIGIIEEIILANEVDNKNHIFARFDNVIVEYTNETFDNITHAYCISIHKSQGSEYPIVIIPLLSEFKIMMQKKLIYTAITRAKKSLIMIGSKEIFNYALSIDHLHERKSTLALRLASKNNMLFDDEL